MQDIVAGKWPAGLEDTDRQRSKFKGYSRRRDFNRRLKIEEI